MAGTAIKITELAVGDANIGGVRVPVNDPGDNIAGDVVLPQMIAHIHQISRCCIFKEKYPFFSRQPIQV